MSDHRDLLPEESPTPSRETSLMLLGALPERSPEEDAVTERGLLHRARDLIRSEFEEATWQMFWRAAVEQQPTDVIAADFGITPNGVRLARSRVQRRLQEEPGEWLEEAV
jgi:RNA polymerase sigma-70 factor (ECF subfamily)